MNLNKTQVDQILEHLDTCLENISVIKEIFQKKDDQEQSKHDGLHHGMKMNPLLFGESKKRVGVYSSAISGDRRVLKLVPDRPLIWESKPIQWLLDQININHYKLDNNYNDALVVELPVKEKFGKLLGQAAWAFDSMNKPLEETR